MHQQAPAAWPAQQQPAWPAQPQQQGGVQKPLYPLYAGNTWPAAPPPQPTPAPQFSSPSQLDFYAVDPATEQGGGFDAPMRPPPQAAFTRSEVHNSNAV